MTHFILTINGGSSSIKFAMFGIGGAGLPLICGGQIEGLRDSASFHVRDASGKAMAEREIGAAVTHEQALSSLLKWLDERFSGSTLVAAGHRVVHGGARFTAPIRVDATAMLALRALVPLAPLHQPHNLAAIEALSKLHPDLPQIACFDTAFHAGQSAQATNFALPRDLTGQGIRRYGFHGLSYEYVAGVLPHLLGPDAAQGRVVVAHLGSGASLCALHGRRSVATTMGFTALDGLMMARRCGTIDPGVILYLMQEKAMTAASVSDLLYNNSGLLGVSSFSDDMRTLLASAAPEAKEAVDLFVYRIGRELGSLAAALGGLDALVFTAGIGEHAPEIRRRVCQDASWLGIKLDEKANAHGGPCISDSKVSAWVVPTDEDLMIARHVVAAMGPMQG